MGTYLEQRSYANKFDDNFKSVAAEIAYDQRLFDISVRLSSAIEDQRQGIDAVLSAKPITWGFRVRSYKYERYFYENFTLRLPYEWEKVLSNNYADYLLYGLEGSKGGLKDVLCIDIGKVREQVLADEDLKNRIEWTDRGGFLAPRYDFFPSPIILTQAPAFSLN